MIKDDHKKGIEAIINHSHREMERTLDKVDLDSDAQELIVDF